MKRIIPFVLLLAAFGCKKGEEPKSSIPSLTGTYAMYKLVDSTNYNNGSPYLIQVFTLAGDTAYIDKGTPYYTVKPNANSNYDPAATVDDTLQFTGSGAGNFRFKYASVPFTVDQSGNYHDTRDAEWFAKKLIVLDKTHIELNVVETNTDQNLLIDRSGIYFKKIN